MIEMTAVELRKFIDENPKVTLIDVRETWEYNVVSIENSIHIPISEIQSRMNDFDEDQTIALYVITELGAGWWEFILSNEFSKIINLRGG